MESHMDGIGRGVIRRLDANVVAKIAAGEVIQRPFNVIKEMLENAIDAHATSIQINVKEGGLKSISIADNGDGIRREDLDIICERFTTSKLQSFDDLQNIATFGFRGEALASISQVAHVTITTMRKGDAIGYKARYKDGKLIGNDAEPCAGTPGTQFTVDDLFYNYPLRKAAMSATDEYARVYDVVTRYALHFAGVAFNLRKMGETKADVSTKRSNTTRDNIRELFGAAIARDLIEIHVEEGPQDGILASQPPTDGLAFKLTGYVSGPTATPKKSVFVLFVNDRLVNMGPLKKFLESQYATVSAKSTSFMYLALQIHPTKVDVNMHPNKLEVGLIDQQAIISKIGEYFVNEIDKVNTQQGFKSNQASTVDDSVPAPKMVTNTNFASKASVAATIIRNDAKEGSMNSYLGPRRSISPDFSATAFGAFTDGPLASSTPNTSKMLVDDDFEEDTRESEANGRLKDEMTDGEVLVASASGSHGDAAATISSSQTLGVGSNAKKRSRESLGSPAVERSLMSRAPLKPAERQTRLFSSVQGILDSLESERVEKLEQLLRDWTFVGCLSSRKSLVQVGNQLLMLDMVVLSRELLYQECLHQIREPRVFQLEEPASIEQLVLMALESSCDLRTKDVLNKEVVAASAVQKLVLHREMLQEYFGVVISEKGDILALPEIVKGYMPANLYGLPLFCYNLYARVAYEDERGTLDGIAKELARLYAVPAEEEPEDLIQGGGGKEHVLLVSNAVGWAIEHQLLPALKRRFYATEAVQQMNAVVLVVSTDKLFKIFERC